MTLEIIEYDSFDTTKNVLLTCNIFKVNLSSSSAQVCDHYDGSHSAGLVAMIHKHHDVDWTIDCPS